MKKLIILSLLCLLSCTDQNLVKIKLDKEIVPIGETITARLYVRHNPLMVPAFYVLTNYDTTMIPNDENDNQCGVYKARFSSVGKKEVSGFVIFINEQDKKDTIDYKFKFEVSEISTKEIPSSPGHK